MLIGLVVLITASASYAVDEKYTPSKNKNLAVVYTLDEIIDKKFFDFAKKDLAKIGFYLNDPHHNVNNVYEERVGLEPLEWNSLSRWQIKNKKMQ